jgi:uncharacterized protein (DUF1499 family)
MPQARGWLWLVPLVIVLLPIVWLLVQARLAQRPANLGLHEGRLSGCPASPNCVSTEADTVEHRSEPIPYQGSAESARATVRQVVESMPGGVVVEEQGDYLRAEFTSRLFRFVDDVEFQIDPRQKVVRYRSASRVGYSDLGANRARMEQFAESFAREAESFAQESERQP